MAVNKEKSKGLGVGDRTNDGSIGQATQRSTGILDLQEPEKKRREGAETV